MELPLQTTFHRLERSDAIAAKVRERAQKLNPETDFPGPRATERD